MVQNKVDIGFDKEEKRKKRRKREEKKEKKRTVCLKKPNLIRPLPHNNTPRHNKPLFPEQKAEIAGEKRKSRETDWVSDSEPFLSSIPQRRKHFSWLNGHWPEHK